MPVRRADTGETGIQHQLRTEKQQLFVFAFDAAIELKIDRAKRPGCDLGDLDAKLDDAARRSNDAAHGLADQPVVHDAG